MTREQLNAKRRDYCKANSERINRKQRERRRANKEEVNLKQRDCQKQKAERLATKHSLGEQAQQLRSAKTGASSSADREAAAPNGPLSATSAEESVKQWLALRENQKKSL